jgi:uncharacterized protein YvpB
MQRRYRRRRLVAALVGLLTIAAITAGGAIILANPHAASKGPVTLELAGERVATLGPNQARRIGEGEGGAPLGPLRVVERGRARITYRIDAPTLRRRLAAASGGEVTVPATPVASRIASPIVKQVFPNNCETAALSMLLASRGVDIDQRTLQRRLPLARPLDPSGSSGARTWGDPEQGFVGRVEGGGPAGGYGVYERPIIDLASRSSTKPVDLSRRPAAAIYDRLLSGHAVMAWIGLSNGPYETWRTPQGGLVRANFGEHTVVLRGVQGDQVLVNDPIDGVRKRWSKQSFEELWQRLGRRAVSV